MTIRHSLFVLAIFAAAAAVLAQNPSSTAPSWIWSDTPPQNGQWLYLRKSFTGNWLGKAQRPAAAQLRLSADARAIVTLNRRLVGRCDDPGRPLVVDVRDNIRRGENILAIEVQSNKTTAGVIADLQIIPTTGGPPIHIVTDAGWLCTPTAEAGWDQDGFKDSHFKPARVIARLGDKPWGDVFDLAAAADSPAATPAEFLEVLPGFKAELLYSVPREKGSWVAMTFDSKGRIIVSNQYQRDPGELYRVSLHQGKVDKVEPIITRLKSDPKSPSTADARPPTPVGGAQGLCWAFDSLYVNANGTSALGTGLYRLRDTDGDDQLDEAQLLRSIEGNSDHGLHAVLPGPDGKSLYIVAGNMTRHLEPIDVSRMPRVWEEDQLLARLWDPRGHAHGIFAPGGVIYRTDPEGRRWELVCGGFRNPYDAAFNAQGELFTYDADMEWDIGSPWYRPTRICHVVSGGDFGWRSGSGKWPVYYPDSLPPAVDIGPGSPTGMIFGANARFPAAYQRALFALDWAYGTIYAVHLQSEGSTYRGGFEKFVTGKPLPVTDAAIGPDGALYFIIGGWKTQSGLYRVSYTGSESTARIAADSADDDARALRRRLESLHGRRDPAAIEIAWPHLRSPDRFIRSAARIAIEHQDPALWIERALKESDASASLACLLAVARCGQATLQPRLIDALGHHHWSNLDDAQRLELLRIHGLAFLRMGKPDRDAASSVIQRIDPHFPAPSQPLNAELSRLLIYLEAPGAIEKTLQLMSKAATQEEQIHYAYVLRTAWRGWSPDQRGAFFGWFERASSLRGGASLPGFIERIRSDALATLSDAERKSLGPLAASTPAAKSAAAAVPQPRGPGRNWTVQELLPLLQAGLRQRNFDNGKAMFRASLCHACHRLDNDGGSLGPDLTGVGSRFGPRDLLESILDPNKVIFDQYQSMLLTLTDGSMITGRILAEESGRLTVAANPLAPDQTVTLDASAIKSRQASPVSLMPPGLMNRLNQDEALDLLAYLLSRGDRYDRVFR